MDVEPELYLSWQARRVVADAQQLPVWFQKTPCQCADVPVGWFERKSLVKILKQSEW